MIFTLIHTPSRVLAHAAIDNPDHDGWVVRINPPNKSRDQEARYHAQVADISAQVSHCGQKFDREVWKRLLIDAYHFETKDDPEYAKDWKKMGKLDFVPALNRPGVVLLGIQSRDFTRKLASGFIDWLEAFGAENGVVWKNYYREPING